MFRGFKCGCIVSLQQGRVRICGIHKPGQSSGDGGGFDGLKGGGTKLYPANGEAVLGWNGR
jgi:hypothetical protein